MSVYDALVLAAEDPRTAGVVEAEVAALAAAGRLISYKIELTPR